ncbi:unnamed protein product, partial [Adineta ricciae]
LSDQTAANAPEYKVKRLPFVPFIVSALAAVWSDNLQLQVVGYRSNTIIANNIYILQVFNVLYITFDGYSGLDSVVFSTSAGTHNLDVVGSGRHFGMDNLCLTFP